MKTLGKKEPVTPNTMFVGEWSSALGKKREEDGTVKLVTTTAPWIGWPEFVPKEQNGKMTLELQDSQRKVVFARVAAGKARSSAER